jgi:hypothetical protein
MPNSVQIQASERVDVVDLKALTEYPRELTKLVTEQVVLDRQSRILRGFRVQLTDQDYTPGRIVVHSGSALDRDGQILINETQSNATRTITLEGATTTFYVELEFVESDAEVDSRAFWDSTVDQGLDIPSGDELPDGQEFNNNIATRKTSDWRIVQPISTTSFERDLDPSSIKVPLIKLITDVSNKITAGANPDLTTEKAATTLLEQISANKIRVQNSSYMPLVGNGIKVSEGEAVEETVTIGSVDRKSGVIGVSTLSNTHIPGAIVRAATFTDPDFITEADYGRYHRPEVIAGSGNVIDYRDRVFQGDEIHGGILSHGHGSIDQRSSTNLQSLQDYVDFLAAQIQEMKWGVTDPYVSDVSSSRVPPGVGSVLPTTPRHFDRAGSLLAGRVATITVGDGVSSFGDLNGITEVVLQAAHDALPGSGRIFLKRGSYKLTADLMWTNTADVVLEGESGTIIELEGGSIHITTTGSVTLKNLTIREGTSTPSNIGILVDTSNPIGFHMDNVLMYDAAFRLNAVLPSTSSFFRVNFWGITASMAAIPLFAITGTIAGTFRECDFLHLSMVSLSCSLIDCVSAPTAAMLVANFVDCSFTSVGINFESVHLGATSNVVSFDRCIFTSFSTLCHVRATGGNNIKFINCVGTDANAQFFQGIGIDHVVVDGYVNNNIVYWPAVELSNCNFGKIVNCDVMIGAVTSLTGSAFRLTFTAVDEFSDFLISGNTVTGDVLLGFGKPTGVIFDINGATHCSEVRITDNVFNACETDIYFANSGSAATYRDMVIKGNNCFDHVSGGLSVHKIGVYFGPTSTRDNVIISNNVFADMRPGSTAVITAGVTRAAVWVAGSNNTNFKISENEIKNLGDSSFTLANTCGIFVQRGYRFTISGNQIYWVIGSAAFGIRISDQLNQSSIVGNTINDISTLTGGGGIQEDCFGIYAKHLRDVVINSNQFTNIRSGGSPAWCGAIGCQEATSEWVNITITGNNLVPSNVITSFVDFSGLYFRRSCITGNTCVGQGYAFLDCSIGSGGIFDGISITGNSARGMEERGIRINCALATTHQNLVISGNTINTVLGNAIDITKVNNTSITGNTLFVDDSSGVMDVFMEDCLFAIVCNNICKVADHANARNIQMASGCRYYQIGSNICDLGGGTAGVTIDTAGSAVVASGEGHVTYNLVDDTVNLNINDDEIGNTPAY